MVTDISNPSVASPLGTGSPQTDRIPPTTDFSDTRRYLGDGFTYTMATVNLCLGIQALLLNIFVISFYFKKRKDTVPLMYLFVSSTDLLTAISALLVSLVLFLQKHSTDASIALVLPAYAIFSVTFKVSVFLNLTVASARTINIIQPFYRINNRAWVIAVAVYILGWIIFTVVQISLEETPQHESVYDAYLYSPGQYQIVERAGHLKNECRNISLFIGLPYLLPSVVVVVCMVVQSHTLLKMQPEKSTNTDVQRNITVTIFMMTVLFFVCNTVYVVYPITHCIEILQEKGFDSETFHDKERKKYMWRFLTGVVAPFVNAAFNPLILIARGKALKAAIRNKSRRITEFTSVGMGRPSRTSQGGGTVLMNMNSVVTDANGSAVVPKRDSRLELSVLNGRLSRVETSLNNRDVKEAPPTLDKKMSKVTFNEIA